MVVRAENRRRGVGRQLLDSLQDAAASLGRPRTWVATGDEAAGFYQRCGWAAVEHLRLESTGIATTILMRPARAWSAACCLVPPTSAAGGCRRKIEPPARARCSRSPAEAASWSSAAGSSHN